MRYDLYPEMRLLPTLNWSILRAMDEPVELPIDGVLDLHTFRPKEVKDLVPDYLEECLKRGIYQVRIIHGKGIGAMRETVHKLLSRNPAVKSFTLDHPQYGGWGATIVYLDPPRSAPLPGAEIREPPKS